jgi:hypothetical protein
MGIAMCHFELAARESGLHGEWRREAPEIDPLPSGTTYTVSWVGE